MSVVTPKRFTVDDYHRLIELGFLTEADRVELIRGELVQMAAKGTPHSVHTGKLCRQLDRVLGDRAVVRCQEPVSLGDSQPEPDAVIAIGRDEDYLDHHPYPGEIYLLIEVSDSTLEYDRTTKLTLYAENTIQHYWIVNLVAQQLEQYSQPYHLETGDQGYRLRQIALRGETVTLPGFEDVTVDLAKIFI